MASASVVSRANTSHKYQKVASTSQVDESLFGNTKPGQLTKGRKQNVASFDSRAGKRAPEVVTLSQSALNRMKGASPILTAGQVAELKKAAEAARDKDRAVSKARKERMLAMEAERKKQVSVTAFSPQSHIVLRDMRHHVAWQTQSALVAVSNDRIGHHTMVAQYLWNACPQLRVDWLVSGMTDTLFIRCSA